MARPVRPFEARAFVLLRPRREPAGKGTRLAELLEEADGMVRVRLWWGRTKKWYARAQWLPASAVVGVPDLGDPRLADVLADVRQQQQAAFQRAASTPQKEEELTMAEPHLCPKCHEVNFARGKICHCLAGTRELGVTPPKPKRGKKAPPLKGVEHLHVECVGCGHRFARLPEDADQAAAGDAR